MNVPNPVAATARTRPDHPVLAAGPDVLTAAALADRAARIAGALYRAGVRPGDRVALRGPADLAFVARLHGIGWLGAAAVPLPHKATGDEIAARLAATAPDARLGDLPDALSLSDSEPLPERDWPLDAPRLVVTTSGTTGPPQPVVLTTSQLMFSAFGSAIRLGHAPTDRWIGCLPLHHVGGLSILFRTAWYGTTTELHPRFDPDRVNAAIGAGATLVSLVPVMLEQVLDARGDRPFPATLRAILLGGAATPASLVERCRHIGAPVALTWGMTEAGSQVATRAPGDLSPHGGSGPPLPFARVSAPNGLLEVDGPLVGGHLRTRDRGHVDDHGNVHVLGRDDDVFVSGGENVSPGEIEDALRAHPAVQDAAVIGIPDDRWGQRPVAFVVVDGASDEDLVTHCRAHLSGFKIPDRFVRVDAVPRNALGKIDRAALRERLRSTV